MFDLTVQERLGRAYNNKGICLMDIGRYQEALECFEKAIESDNEAPHYYTNKGIVLHELGEYLEALETFDKAINKLTMQQGDESLIDIAIDPYFTKNNESNEEYPYVELVK